MSARALARHLESHPRAAPGPALSSPGPERRRDLDEESPATSRSPHHEEIAAPRSSEPRVRVDAGDELDVLMREITQHLQLARKDPAAKYSEKSALIGKALSAIRLKKQLTGELGQTEVAALANPRVRRLLKDILDALKPFPDAARAVLERIEGTANEAAA